MKKGKAPSKKSGADPSRKGDSAPSTSRKPATKAPTPGGSSAKGKPPAGKPAVKPGSAPAKPSVKPTPKAAPKAAPKPAAKPAAKPTPKAAAKPAPKPSMKPSPKASSPSPKSTQTAGRVAASPAPGAKGSKAAPAGKPAARPQSARPLAAPIAVSPKVEAPKKFQREYKKWLERLILLRHALLRDGERLEEEGLKALEQEVSVDHMADFGSDSYEQDNTLALIESKSEALRDVDESIRKIEVGSYGLCEECEQLIPSGRLEVLPHARYCVNCQSKREGVVE